MNEKIHSKPKVLRRPLVVACIALALLPLLAAGAAQLLVVHSPLPNADAIVVMSGSATFRERAQHAAVLFNEGRAPRIVLTNDHLQSGWSQAKQRNPFYYELSIEELRRAGVPNERISVIMSPITSTYDEAVLLKDYSETNHLNSLLVVTSAFHSRRAFWTFRRVFKGSGKLIGIEPAEPHIESPATATWWLHRAGWEMVPNEYVKMLVYWFRY